MTPAPFRVVIAPDSFKGSATSPVVARAMAAGVRAAIGGEAQVVEVPLADGGEGTLDALVAAWGGAVREVPTTDAAGRDRLGRIGLTPDGTTAIIETAEANGLPHVDDLPPRPLEADTYGVGLLVLGALEAGATELLLCLGGSATNDGGAGLLRALGVQLLDGAGIPVAVGARGLHDLARIDASAVAPGARAARWRIACDVDNPLTGPRGAAATFGPQKGATPDDVTEIDAGLLRLSEVLARETGRSASELAARPGTGAAGGLALGPLALFDAELVPGAEVVAEVTGLREAMTGAHLVLAGEGRLDRQSLDGKVLSSVLALAEAPVVVIAGSVALSAEECRAAGIAGAFSIAPGPASLAELRADTERLLSDAAAQVCGVFASRG